MAYSEKIASRIRNSLHTKKVEEKSMMGGLTFMVDGKMCVGVHKNKLMARIGPENYESALKRKGCRKMDFTGKALKGFIFVNENGTKSKKEFDYWINLALEFNRKARSSKKR